MCKTNEKEGGFQTFYCTGLQIRLTNLYLHPLFTVTERYFRTSNWSVRLGVRTPDFHSGNTGSIPVQTTNNMLNSPFLGLFCSWVKV